eukprot:6610990-Pyramimonas_sp.AAC.1
MIHHPSRATIALRGGRTVVGGVVRGGMGAVRRAVHCPQLHAYTSTATLLHHFLRMCSPRRVKARR